MPVRNGAQFIGQAIDSVLSQTLADLELLIVDDASTDKTPRIIQSYADPRLRYLRNSRCAGVSAARNRALREARAPFVAFLDADDIAYPQRLELQIAYLNAHQEVALVGAHVDYIDAEGHLLFSEKPGQRPGEPAALRMELLRRACILPSSATGRTKVLLDCGGFPEQMRYAEDHDLWCRIAVGHDLAILPERLVAYRQHPNQATFRKIRTAYRATQACIAEARKRFAAAGILCPESAGPMNVLERLGGAPGSLGATYRQWAELYSWALRQPRQAFPLAATALLYAPLDRRAWKTLGHCLEKLLVPQPIARALRWYGAKFRRALGRSSE
jgi:glycosyltransferase involved in cell wall biosynthesis